jgi:two-component system, NarL family, invasion response regulator UvrY
VRLFIASADKTFRLALLLLLESEPGMVVTGMSDRSGGLLASVTAMQPEVLLLDDGLATQAMGQLVNDLHLLEFHPKVIVLSPNPQTAATTLAAGADGFISKSAPPDELLPILRSMRSADTHLSPPMNSPM